MTTEEWRWLPGWEDTAAVSNLGRVFCEHGGGLLTPYMDSVEYVRLWHNGPKINVARAVLSAFVRPGTERDKALHINDRNDNRLVNLKWGTKRDLARHSASKRQRTRGVILPEEKRMEIREKILNNKASYADLAKWYGVSERTIRRIGDE